MKKCCQNYALKLLMGSIVLMLTFCTDENWIAPNQDPVADKGGLLIKHPNGGETFKIGDSVTIRFGTVDANNPEVGCVFELYKGGSSILTIEDEEIMVSAEEISWKIPAAIVIEGQAQPFPAGNDFRIHIASYGNSYPNDDYSDASFTIEH